MIGAFQAGVVGSARLWTPAYMTTALLWLDAADANTITKDESNLISQWNDKSGGGCHATQGTGAAQPTSGTKNDLAAVLFDGSDFITAPVTGFKSLTSVEIFMLTTPTAAAEADVNSFTGWNFGNFAAASGSYPYSKNLGFGSTTGLLSGEKLTIFGTDSGRLGASTYSRASNTSQILSTAFTTSGSEVYVNGSSLSLDLAGGITTSSDITPSVSGYTVDDDVHINGTRSSGTIFAGPANAVHEFLIVSPVSSASNRIKIEGYLAHKWGLAASLPSNHQYRYYPPMV